MTVLNSRWFFKALMAASLLLNLSLGWMLLRPAPAPEAAAPASLQALKRIADELPEADRAALTQAMLAHAMPIRTAQKSYQAHAGRVLELLVAEPLDVEALRAEIAAARASRQVAVDELVAAFLEALPDISRESRREIAERGSAAKAARSEG